MSTNGWILTGGQCLDDGAITTRDCVIDGAAFRDVAPTDARRFDATGLILSPGIIDLHGDAFERNVSPRPRVFFDTAAALLETDRQLISNGITTAYLALTISWEPGLRSLDQGRALIETLERVRPDLLCDIRLQIRWEACALDAVDQVKAWLELDPKPVLAFNDHFSDLLTNPRMTKKIGDFAARADMTEAEYRAQITDVTQRRDEVSAATEHLARTARKSGVICFAHDERDIATRQANRDLGITVSEFPLTSDTAREAIDAKEPTILGAPNVLRGGSHIGAVDAEPAIANGLCSVLASDYYYPAPFLAVHRLSKGDLGQLSRHWPLISANAARAVALDDRGSLETGKRADLVAFSKAGATPRIEAVFSAGKLVHLTSQDRI